MVSSKEIQLQSFYDRLNTYVGKDKLSKAVIVCDKIIKAEENQRKVKSVLQTKCACQVLLAKYEQALDIAQKNGFDLEKAYILYKQQQTEEAIKALELARSSDSGELESHVRAQLFYRVGKYEEANQIYESIMGKRSKQEVTNELLANSCAAKLLSGNPEQCIEELDEHADLLNQPSNYELLYNKACAMLQLGETQTALNTLEQSMQNGRSFLEEEDLLPKEDIERELSIVQVQQAYAKQSNKVLASKSEDEIRQVYLDTLSNFSEEAAACAVAANNLFALRGDHELFDSYKIFRTAVTESAINKLPAHQGQTLWFNKAILSLKLQKSTECRDLIRELTVKYPDSEVPQLIEVSLLLREKKQAKAVEILEQLVEEASKSGDSKGAFYLLALVQLQTLTGVETSKSIDLLRSSETFKFHPKVVEATLSLLESTNQVEEAARYVEGVVSQAKNEVSDKKNLLGLALLQGKFHLSHGDNSQAAEIFEGVMEGKFGPVDGMERLEALANFVTANATLDLSATELKARVLPMPPGVGGIDVAALNQGTELKERRIRTNIPPRSPTDPSENLPLTKVSPSHSFDLVAMKQRQQAAKAKKTAKRKAKLRELYLAKLKEKNGENFDPEKNKPDPERWIPMSMRSNSKKSRKRRGIVLTGAQGAGGTSSSQAARLDARAVDEARAAAASSTATKKSNRKGKGRR